MRLSHSLSPHFDISTDELDKQNALHRELGETHSFMERTINGLAEEADVFSTVPYHSKNQQEPDSDKIIPMKNFTYTKSHGSPIEKSYEFDSYEDEGSGGDNIATNAVKKSTRACKGKRYQEFMNARKQNPFARKSKSRSTSTSSASLSPTELRPRNAKLVSNAATTANSNASRKMDYESFDHLYANHAASIAMPPMATSKIPDIGALDVKASAGAKDELATMKYFDASDFDLEEKIKALPGRSLDSYLSRKRDTKKKKKINGKRSSNATNRKNAAHKHSFTASSAKKVTMSVVAPPQTIQEAKERLMMVGSQKRKARKESITRRDVHPINAITESIILSSTPLQPSPPPSAGPASESCNPSDLLILATMAEKAAAIIGV